MRFLNNFLCWIYSGKYTKVKLITKESIGVDDGYFECKKELIEIGDMLIKDVKLFGIKLAKDIYKERIEELDRKYFGPMYVKDN